MNTCPHNEEVRPAVRRLSRQHARAEVRRKAKRPPALLLPTRYTELAFYARLEKLTIAQLGRKQARLQRLLKNCDRLVSEHGGKDSVVGRLVTDDRAIWERQLLLVQGLIIKRTKSPARRDARPKRLQKLDTIDQSGN